MSFSSRYNTLVNTPSDINEHLPTLFSYARECESILELGVRGCVSSVAFCYGLTLNNKDKKLLYMNDIQDCPVKDILEQCKKENIIGKFFKCNDLDLQIEPVDLVFIDTWHIYGQLKRELEKFHKLTNLIILHDTETDKIDGETIRCKWNPEQQSLSSKIPVKEITCGLSKAIKEFLLNKDWYLEREYHNNNGLTVLRKISYTFYNIYQTGRVFPIGLSIPKCKIVSSIPIKIKTVSSIIPNDTHSYIYTNEQDYYNEYRSSLFALTKKKGGWDCLRHYEILSQGCIPVFDLSECPLNTLYYFPKTLIKECYLLYNKYKDYKIEDCPYKCFQMIDKLLDYTKRFLTTEFMAKVIVKDKKNVLFLSQDSPDYIKDLILHGMKSIVECHDYPKINHIYTGDYSSLYGRGISYTNLLDHQYHNIKKDNTLLEDIRNHCYDLIVYGSYHRGLPHIDEVEKYYNKDEIILICGEDEHNCDYNDYVRQGYTVYVRELTSSITNPNT